MDTHFLADDGKWIRRNAGRCAASTRPDVDFVLFRKHIAGEAFFHAKAVP